MPSPDSRRFVIWIFGLIAAVTLVIAYFLIPAKDPAGAAGYALDEPLPPIRNEALAASGTQSPLVSLVGLIALVDSFFPEGDAAVAGPLADMLEMAPLPALPDQIQPAWDQFLALRRRIEAGEVEVIPQARESLLQVRSKAQQLLDDPPPGW
jgi:hypothetical protein